MLYRNLIPPFRGYNLKPRDVSTVTFDYNETGLNVKFYSFTMSPDGKRLYYTKGTATPPAVTPTRYGSYSSGYIDIEQYTSNPQNIQNLFFTSSTAVPGGVWSTTQPNISYNTIPSYNYWIGDNYDVYRVNSFYKKDVNGTTDRAAFSVQLFIDGTLQPHWTYPTASYRPGSHVANTTLRHAGNPTPIFTKGSVFLGNGVISLPVGSDQWQWTQWSGFHASRAGFFTHPISAPLYPNAIPIGNHHVVIENGQYALVNPDDYSESVSQVPLNFKQLPEELNTDSLIPVSENRFVSVLGSNQFVSIFDVINDNIVYIGRIEIPPVHNNATNGYLLKVVGGIGRNKDHIIMQMFQQTPTYTFYSNWLFKSTPSGLENPIFLKFESDYQYVAKGGLMFSLSDGNAISIQQIGQQQVSTKFTHFDLVSFIDNNYQKVE